MFLAYSEISTITRQQKIMRESDNRISSPGRKAPYVKLHSIHYWLELRSAVRHCSGPLQVHKVIAGFQQRFVMQYLQFLRGVRTPEPCQAINHITVKLKTMIIMIEMKQFSKRMVLNSTLKQIIAEDHRDLLLVFQVKEGRIVFIPAAHLLICIIVCYLLKSTSKKRFMPKG